MYKAIVPKYGSSEFRSLLCCAGSPRRRWIIRAGSLLRCAELDREPASFSVWGRFWSCEFSSLLRRASSVFFPVGAISFAWTVSLFLELAAAPSVVPFSIPFETFRNSPEVENEWGVTWPYVALSRSLSSSLELPTVCDVKSEIIPSADVDFAFESASIVMNESFDRIDDVVKAVP